MNIKKIFSAVFFLWIIFPFFSETLAESNEDAIDEYFPNITEEYTIEDHKLSVNDLYMKAYNALDDSYHPSTTQDTSADNPNLIKNAYKSVAIGMGISTKTLQAMLIENPNSSGEYCPAGEPREKCVLSLLKQYCPNQPQETNPFIVCQNILKNRIHDEYERSRFEQNLGEYAKSSQSFLNGTLQDTGKKSFDIIVDLNIIDLILFGDKMTLPRNGSPFMPTFPFKKTKKNTVDGETQSNSFNADWEEENNASSETSDSSEENEDEDDDNTQDLNENTDIPKEFCMDPDGKNFSDTITSQFLGVNDNRNDTVHNEEVNNGNSFDYGLMQAGNIVPAQIQYTGGEYPDLSMFQKRKQCGENEKPYFGGRVCIPEFCTDLICIKIKFTMEKTRSQKLDCVECHIDRANEALNPFVATLGQGTPNQNSMESFFLSAFANLFKDVTKSITLKPKRLPFMLYDTPLSDQKKEKEEAKRKAQEKKNQENSENSENTESTDNAETKENTEKKSESPQLQKNKKLYDQMLLEECAELKETFTPHEGYLDESTAFCNSIRNDSTALDEGYLNTLNNGDITNNQNEKMAKGRSDLYQTVVEPFLWQMSKDMVSINSHIQDIDPKTIQKTGQHCKTKAQSN